MHAHTSPCMRILTDAYVHTYRCMYILTDACTYLPIDAGERLCGTSFTAEGAVPWQLRLQPSHIIMGELIGEGAYGIVHCGTYRSRPVAIKRMRMVRGSQLCSQHVCTWACMHIGHAGMYACGHVCMLVRMYACGYVAMYALGSFLSGRWVRGLKPSETCQLYACACMPMHMHACLCMCMHVHVCVHVHACPCVCACTCTCIGIHA